MTPLILKNDEVAEILQALKPRIVVPMHYRLEALEPKDGPEDLGAIDPWLEGKQGVRRLGTHRVDLTPAALPEETEIWIFEPSPLVPRPHSRE